MANTNAPYGFKAIKAASSEVRVEYCNVASGASRIGKGDLVTMQSDGTVARSSSATDAGPWFGVSMADTGTLTGPLTAHPVCIDGTAIFEVQASTAALATTDLGTIVYVDTSSAPDSSTGVSKNVLTNTAATGSNGVRILRFVNSPDNVAGASARVEVILNARQLATGSAGI